LVSSWLKDGIAAMDSSVEVALVVPDVGSGSAEGGCSCDCNIAPKRVFLWFLSPKFVLSCKNYSKSMRNPLPNWLKALFVFYFYIHALKMTHVQIRGGVADWYWTADQEKRAFSWGKPSRLVGFLGYCK